LRDAVVAIFVHQRKELPEHVFIHEFAFVEEDSDQFVEFDDGVVIDVDCVEELFAGVVVLRDLHDFRNEALLLVLVQTAVEVCILPQEDVLEFLGALDQHFGSHDFDRLGEQIVLLLVLYFGELGFVVILEVLAELVHLQLLAERADQLLH